MGTRRPSPRRRRTTVKPSMSGIITSRTIRSGRKRRASVTAARPLVAVDTSNPAYRRLTESSSTMFGSSSTTSSLSSGFAPAAPPAEARPLGCVIGKLISVPPSGASAGAAQGDGCGPPLTVAGVGHRDRVTRLVRAHGRDQGVRVRDRARVGLDDDVTVLQAGLGRTAAGAHLPDHRATGRGIGDRDTELGVGRLLAVDQLVGDRLRLVDRGGETDADVAAL